MQTSTKAFRERAMGMIGQRLWVLEGQQRTSRFKKYSLELGDYTRDLEIMSLQKAQKDFKKVTNWRFLSKVDQTLFTDSRNLDADITTLYDHINHPPVIITRRQVA